MVDNMEQNTEFEPIPLLESLVYINEDIVNKMSTDSLSAWKYLQAVVKDKNDSGVVDLKCGKLCYSRSLNAWHELPSREPCFESWF